MRIIAFSLGIFLFCFTGLYSQSSQLEVTDLKVGNGREAKKGFTVRVHYTGWLYTTKKKFDSSYDRKEPFEFQLGRGNVIPGWDRGIVGMKEGGKRKLVIPPILAYGETGNSSIPPDSTLVFEVELLQVD